MNAAPTANHVANIDLEYIFSYWATLTSPEVVGPIAEGIRVNFYVTAGEVSGPKMRGRLRTVGGDWLLLRTDGVGLLDVRATLELDNGALIYTTYGGVVDLGPDGYNLFFEGNPTASPGLANRATVSHWPSRISMAQPLTMCRRRRVRCRAVKSELRHLCHAIKRAGHM